MVDKNELRHAFGLRLQKALDDAGVRARGRGVDVQRQLQKMGVHITPQAISKWLKGETMAEPDSMIALCNWLKVRREWLEYGTLPSSDSSSRVGAKSPTQGDLSPEYISQETSKVPILTWREAAQRCMGSDIEYRDGTQWIHCPAPVSSKAFALEIMGDAMTYPGNGRSYPAGCIIFADPDVATKTGDRVIALVPGTKELTFKVWAEDAGVRFLKPINPQYPVLRDDGDLKICAKVVGSFMPE